jgi:Uma2 family endonuclease
MIVHTNPLTLEEFLALPDTKPASEYINGKIIQKPMPMGKHSLIQSKLIMAINQPSIMFPFPELRCVFAGCAVVPDLAVFKYENIPWYEDDTVTNDFNLSPDWIIEISSPGQSHINLIKKILYCLQYSNGLGWLIDIEEKSIFVCNAHGKVEIVDNPSQKIAVPDFAESVRLTNGDIFG